MYKIFVFNSLVSLIGYLIRDFIRLVAISPTLINNRCIISKMLFQKNCARFIFWEQ